MSRLAALAFSNANEFRLWLPCLGIVFCLSGCRGNSPPAAPPVAAPSRAIAPGAASLPGNGGLEWQDVTASSKVSFAYSSGAETNFFSILESVGGGVALFDYDGDGALDLLFPGGGKLPKKGQLEGRPSGLFRQLEPWQFARLDEVARIDDSSLYTHGVAVGDYDEDGFEDLVITGYDGLRLWHNQGDGTFTLATESAGLVDTAWSTSAAWGDLNGDGLLDLYVAHYVNWSWENDPPCAGPPPHGREVCSPKDFIGLDDIVFYANGDGTYRDASREAGLVPEGKGLGVLIVDLDLDGDRDVFVATDEDPNLLYINAGAGQLREEAGLRGVATDDAGLVNGSMGIDIFDFNQDGWLDLWVSNFENESFAVYRNDGGAHFTHVSRRMGIASLPHTFVGFGSVAADFNRDGHEDIAVVNGHVSRFSRTSTVKQQPLLLTSDGKRFTRCSFADDNFFSRSHTGRGLAAGDLDEDGDLDLIASNQEEPVVLLQNNSEAVGDWLSLQLIGTRSGRSAIGTTAILQTSSGDFIRQVKGGGSYLSHSDRRLFWGLPKGAEITGLSVRWSSGLRQELPPPAAGQRHVVIEPLD